MQQSNIEILYAKYGKDFVEFVLAVITNNLPKLKKEVSYKAKHLLGVQLWEDTTPEQHKLFGNIISDLVIGGHLPLEETTKSANNHNRYKLC
jgi:hypothetical protein